MLTPRLEMLLRHVFGKSAADIGTDHAYVPIRLAGKGIRMIAADISDGPLRAAEENVKKSGEQIELRKGSGLVPFSPGEVDTFIIAGMGGELIEKILSDSPEVAKKSLLLLQPMNSQEKLRHYLLDNNYCIVREDLAKEGHKIYNLIVACDKNDLQKYNSGESAEYKVEIDYHLPPCLYSHNDFPVLLAKKEREFSKICSGLKAAADEDCERIIKYEGLLSELKRIKEGH